MTLTKSTAQLKILGGTPIVIPNRTDEVNTYSKHWYISYNNHHSGRNDFGCDTTALVLGNAECFFILNGDHREGLRACIECPDPCYSALVKCLVYLRENKDQLNPHSDPLI